MLIADVCFVPLGFALFALFPTKQVLCSTERCQNRWRSDHALVKAFLLIFFSHRLLSGRRGTDEIPKFTVDFT